MWFLLERNYMIDILRKSTEQLVVLLITLSLISCLRRHYKLSKSWPQMNFVFRKLISNSLFKFLWRQYIRFLKKAQLIFSCIMSKLKQKVIYSLQWTILIDQHEWQNNRNNFMLLLRKCNFATNFFSFLCIFT